MIAASGVSQSPGVVPSVTREMNGVLCSQVYGFQSFPNRNANLEIAKFVL